MFHLVAQTPPPLPCMFPLPPWLKTPPLPCVFPLPLRLRHCLSLRSSGVTMGVDENGDVKRMMLSKDSGGSLTRKCETDMKNRHRGSKAERQDKKNAAASSSTTKVRNPVPSDPLIATSAAAAAGCPAGCPPAAGAGCWLLLLVAAAAAAACLLLLLLLPLHHATAVAPKTHGGRQALILVSERVQMMDMDLDDIGEDDAWGGGTWNDTRTRAKSRDMNMSGDAGEGQSCGRRLCTYWLEVFWRTPGLRPLCQPFLTRAAFPGPGGSFAPKRKTKEEKKKGGCTIL